MSGSEITSSSSFSSTVKKNNIIIEMSKQANENATYLFKIYLRQMLNSKKVVLNDKLNS